MKRFLNSVRDLPGWTTFWRQYYALRQPAAGLDELKVPLRGGLTAFVPATLMSAFDEVFLRRVYGGARVSAPARAPLVLDVGANAGFFSLSVFARHPAARVLAFEPLPGLAALLERQRAANPWISLTIDRRAIAGESGTAKIHFDGRRDYSVDASLFPHADAEATLTVETTTLDRVFDEHAIERCHLLKLDCEGAEHDILRRCPDRVYRATEAIVLEVHEDLGERGSARALAAFLRGKGYRVRNRRNEILTCRR